jgi:GTPase involved in cell partitioning and DNA repair
MGDINDNARVDIKQLKEEIKELNMLLKKKSQYLMALKVWVEEEIDAFRSIRRKFEHLTHTALCYVREKKQDSRWTKDTLDSLLVRIEELTEGGDVLKYDLFSSEIPTRVKEIDKQLFTKNHLLEKIICLVQQTERET